MKRLFERKFNKAIRQLKQNDPTLIHLDLSDKQIGDEGAKVLADGLLSNTTLQALNLRDNQIGDEGAKALAEALKQQNTTLSKLFLPVTDDLQNTALTTLNLDGNKIGDEGAKAFASALRSNTTLVTLSLSYNQFGHQGGTALTDVSKTSKTLSELHLLMNSKIGDEGAKASSNTMVHTTNDMKRSFELPLEKAIRQLKQNDPKLTSLDLSDKQIGDEGVKALADALLSNTTLSILTLRNNEISDEGAIALAEALNATYALYTLHCVRDPLNNPPVALHTALTTLDLDGNLIGSEGAKALASALKSNTTLSTLYLWNNRIGDEGATALASALRTNSTLLRLRLSCNHIGHGGAKALSAALRTNKGLSELFLQNNQIGSKGATALASALKANKGLSTLHLQSNAIDDEGVIALASSLQTNMTLSSLSLRSNHIGNKGAKALLTVLKDYNTTLQSTDLDHNHTLDSLKHQIHEILVCNEKGTRRDLSRVQGNRDKAIILKIKRRRENFERHRKEDKARLELQEDRKAKEESKEKTQLEPLQFEKEIERKRVEEEQKHEDKARLEQPKREEEDPSKLLQREEEEGQRRKGDVYLARQQGDAEGERKRVEEEERQRQEKDYEEQQQRGMETKNIGSAEMNRLQKPMAETQVNDLASIEDCRQALQHSRQSKHLKPIFVTGDYIQCIQTSEHLGNGFFGTVHRGYDSVLAMEFAVKTNRVPLHLLDEEHLAHVKKSFRTELETLHAFDHPNIASLYAYHMSPDFKSEQYLLYELAEKGSLSGFLKSNFGRDRLSSFQLRVQIAVEVMTAMNFLHEGTKEIKCFHRDIKADNIVLMADMTAKLIDCGLAKFVPRTGEASATGGGKGTDEYMCPMYQRNMLDEYEAKCDIFSFGVVLAELWTGRMQNHHDHTTGEKVNYYEKFVLDHDDILLDMDNALDITDCTEMPVYATEFARLSVQCMSRKLKTRPSGAEVLSRLQTVLAQREQDTMENADVREKQEAEHPASTSIRMQCVECRQVNVRCHPTSHMGYICLPCLLLDMRREYAAQIIPQISAARGEIREMHEWSRNEHRQTRKENRECHERTHATLESFSGVLASLDARMVNKIPALFVLLPAEQSKFRQHPRSWLKDRTRTKYRIYFVCAHTFRAVNKPLKFRVSKDWVVRIAPLLACSLYALHIAGQAVTGIDLDLLAVAKAANFQCIDTKKLSEMLDSVMNLMSGESPSNHEELVEDIRLQRLVPSSISGLEKDSIDPIVELASFQREWFQEMKHVRHPSNQARSMWVLKESVTSTTQFETVV